MPRDTSQLLTFNRGLVSPLALARTDLDRVALSAETQTNWMPRVFGPMMLRPGLEYISTLSGQAFLVPFVFATNDLALVEFRNVLMTVHVDEAVITRTARSTTITNGTFDSDITTGWTDNDEGTASSAHVAGGYMGLTGTGTDAAKQTQQLTVAAADQNTEHGIKIIIQQGPVTVRMGSTEDDDDLFSGELGTGEHSLAVTPTGASIWVEFSNRDRWQKLVDSIAMEGSGAISLTSPYAEADLEKIRYDQSADVIYLACEGYHQYKIERRATRTWSLVKYEPLDGPFRPENTGDITISASAIQGEVTLTASRPLFKSGHAGALFRIESVGQIVTANLGALNAATDEIRVTGVENTRRFIVQISGTFVGTVTLQRSVVEPGSWVDVQSWTGATSLTYDDGLDNQITYYRLQMTAYTSGTAAATLTYNGGSIIGITKIRTVTNETTVTASVIKNLGGTEASALWAEGFWSTYRGFPSAVALYEGRTWWAGKDNIWGSASDAFEGFDDFIEGDSGPISRTIGQGPVDRINWLLPLLRLMIGTDSAEKGARSSSFDEPLTPTAFSLKNSSTQGSAEMAAIAVDTSGIFVQRSGLRVYLMGYDGGKFDYASTDLTRIYPDVASPGVRQVAVQRQPDTRIHCVLDDGNVVILVFDDVEDVQCWVRFETDGNVEQCVVLPGTDEDQVYYVINRDTGRFIEKWALESECQGGTTNKCVDSHVVYSGAATTSITGLSHLNGESVVVWADGDAIVDSNGAPELHTVSGGAIALSTAASDVIVGLPYTAQFKSTKLSSQTRPFLNIDKMIRQIGLILGPTHRQGLEYGQDFTTMDNLPVIEDETTVSSDYQAYDEPFIPFNGTVETDARVCLQGQAPKHATVMAVLLDTEYDR